VKEVTMLELEPIDLEMPADALEDHSPDARWLRDCRTGEVEAHCD
jgi:hypothetical protein